MRVLAIYVGLFVLMVADIAANHGQWTRAAGVYAHVALSYAGIG